MDFQDCLRHVGRRDLGGFLQADRGSDITGHHDLFVAVKAIGRMRPSRRNRNRRAGVGPVKEHVVGRVRLVCVVPVAAGVPGTGCVGDPVHVVGHDDDPRAGETLGHSHNGPSVDGDGIGLKDAEQIFFLAFTALPSNATMSNARDATVTVACALFGADGSLDKDFDEVGNSITINEPQATSDAWAAVGLTNTTVCAAPDTTAPAVPTGLTASASDGTVSLGWVVNIEPDLDGYNVYRSTMSGGPYGQINTPIVTTNAYTDNNVTNGTTYYYVVTAVDTSDNESGNSNEYSATPPLGGAATTMHVQSIVLMTLDQGGGFKKARATVTIQDDLGNTVSGASVTGTFTGDLDETIPDAITDASGQAVLTTASEVRGRLKFTFCVDDVVDASDALQYDNTVNDCDSN